MKKIIYTVLFFCSAFFSLNLKAEDGYRLWLRYYLIQDQHLLNEYKNLITGLLVEGNSSTIAAAKSELQKGLEGLLGAAVPEVSSFEQDGILAAGVYMNLKNITKPDLSEDLKKAGTEGFIIRSGEINGKKVIIITANQDIGILYGVFNFLRMLQTNRDIKDIQIASTPKIKLRLLNHWDNLDRTVERGYAGFSIWDWHFPGNQSLTDWKSLINRLSIMKAWNFPMLRDLNFLVDEALALSGIFLYL